MEDVKLLIKLKDENDEYRWTHLCYVDKSLYEEFTKDRDYCNWNDLLSRWTEEQFKISLPMLSVSDIAELKDLVREHFKEQYPEIYKESNTDRQGWMRVWINQNIKKELEYGKACV